MSNFQQAIKWLKEGKKVQRTSLRNQFKYLILDGSILRDETNEFWTLNLYDFEAIDWEIYEELKKQKKNEGDEE